MKLGKLIWFIRLILCVSVYKPLDVKSQSCSGHWVNNRPLTYQCISGQHIGYNNSNNDPLGCPTSPLYTTLQTNSFIFNNPVTDFFIDFNAFNSFSVGCSRIQIKINGLFYPINSNDLIELPSGTNCLGSVSFLSVSTDGYITTNVAEVNGQGRLVFSGVNASSISISTNDPAGIIVANPCFAPLPIKIKSLKGYAINNCHINLEFESGVESNVRNIEIQGSFDGGSFLKLFELNPRGSYSKYSVNFKSNRSIFYRLKINDLDGSFSFSEIIRVNNNCISPLIRISPNPSTNKISVENIQPNDQLIIVDVTGREVFRQLVMSSFEEFNIQHLPIGLYFVKVSRKYTKLETIKLLKR